MGMYISQRSDDRGHVKQELSQDVYGYPTPKKNISRSDSNITSDSDVYIRPCDIREDVDRKHTTDKFQVNKDRWLLNPDGYGYMMPQATTQRSDSNVTSKSGVYNIPYDKKEEIYRETPTSTFQFNEEMFTSNPGSLSVNGHLQANKHAAKIIYKDPQLRRHNSYHYMDIRQARQGPLIHHNSQRSTGKQEMVMTKQKMSDMQTVKSEGFDNSKMHRSVSMNSFIDTSRGIRTKHPLQADHKQSKEGHSNSSVTTFRMSQSFRQETQNRKYSAPSQQHRSFKRENSQRREYIDQFERDAGLETGRTEMWNIENLYVPTEELYVMDGDRSGLCVIFNMETVGTTSRFGTEIDVNGLKKSFGNLGFDLEVIQNPTRRAIKDYMNSVKSLSHHRKDSFVCVILSHGRDGHIRSSDNEDVPLLEIIEPVKSCESLIGKPKLFFVQACRGSKTDNGVWTDAAEDISDDNLRKLSLHSNLLVSYATIEDFVAYRNGKDGSIYIKILCYLLDKEGFTTKLTDILKKVNRMTLDAFGDSSVCQVPSFTSTLRKSVLFKQKQEKKARSTFK
ncbi:cell death protein 3-like [Mytilus californianus]|uniref:cell death protein 3-like n=1 Tax=Mytilus californianus TaxID=6549 RepID=UPI0022469C90|nr:cell death protein 3-like [Mytilus californianus]